MGERLISFMVPFPYLNKKLELSRINSFDKVERILFVMNKFEMALKRFDILASLIAQFTFEEIFVADVRINLVSQQTLMKHE